MIDKNINDIIDIMGERRGKIVLNFLLQQGGYGSILLALLCQSVFCLSIH